MWEVTSKAWSNGEKSIRNKSCSYTNRVLPIPTVIFSVADEENDVWKSAAVVQTWEVVNNLLGAKLTHCLLDWKEGWAGFKTNSPRWSQVLSYTRNESGKGNTNGDPEYISKIFIIYHGDVWCWIIGVGLFSFATVLELFWPLQHFFLDIDRSEDLQ